MSKSKVDEFLDEIVVRKDGKETVFTEERVRELVSMLIEKMGEEATHRNDFGMNATLTKLLIDIKKSFWPATQKSVQANVDFNQSLRKWYELQTSLLEKAEDKNQKIVYDVA